MSSIQQNAAGIVLWSWDFGDSNTTNTVNPSHYYLNPGIYNASLIVTDSSSCSDTINHNITVDSLPNAQFSVSDICLGYSAPVSNLSNGTSGVINAWSWDFGDGSSSSLENPNHIYSNYGIYNISLSVGDDNGCSRDTTMEIVVYPNPIPEFTAPYLCLDDEVNFTDISTIIAPLGETLISWAWDFGNGSSSSDQNPSVLYDTSGSYMVSLTVLDLNGCVDSISNSVIVYDNPIADFEYSESAFNIVEFTDLTLAGSSAMWDASWSFGDNSSATGLTVQHEYNVAEYNSVSYFTICETVVDANLCADEFCRDIEIESYSLWIPNAFSPEGHGGGDETKFLPKGKSLYTYHIKVFDTWGNLIWESKAINPDDGSPLEYWDGRVNGIMMPQDVYVWEVEANYSPVLEWQGKEYNRGKIRKTGTVTLIK
ncbi:MAG TPA: PKD domain-containing protein [Flavobacteriales bacterium]|nr:PKD domain-containing protein [Flavobacteriales bacterium]